VVYDKIDIFLLWAKDKLISHRAHNGWLVVSSLLICSENQALMAIFLTLKILINFDKW